MADPVIVTLPDQQLLDAVGAPPAGVELRHWDVTAPPGEALGSEDAARVVAVVLPYSSRATALPSLADLPSLRLVQVLSAGFDNVVGKLPAGAALANGAGVHDASTAELAMGLVLTSLRGIDRAVLDQQDGTWRSSTAPRRSLADSRVLVLGVGGIGGAIIDRLRPFEVDVVRVASRARTDDAGEVHGIDELPQLLPTADVVVLGLPLNEATSGLVDAGFLAAMPDGALLVNVGRGKLVDTDALLAELTSGRLRAGLDVVDPEPLPADHPLWRAPGVVITPHVGGGTTAMLPRAVALLRRQLERIAAGEEPVNLVDLG